MQMCNYLNVIYPNIKCGLLKYEKYKIKYIKYKNCSNMNESSKMDKT